VLAAVLAAATILESKYGRVHAQWFVYGATWFVLLLGLLGVNIFCAAASRWPWKRHQIGFVVTHAGLLVLLFGSIQTFVSGVEGTVSLTEGESATSMMMPNRTQLTAFWAGRPEEPPYFFFFEGGPVQWRAGANLALGNLDGVKARVVSYLPHAEPVEDWIEDTSNTGGPYVRFRVAGPQSQGNFTNYLSDQDFGDEIFVGPIRLSLERAATDKMLDDFLQPPAEGLGEKGLLAVYYEDHVQHVAVHEGVGKKIELGDTGAAFEIAEYFPDAKPDAHGQFSSKTDEPANPMLELLVHLPGEGPLRQLAFAKSPLLNLNAIYDDDCPVTFRYYHPGLKPAGAIELLQTSDGKLHCRAIAGGQYTAVGEVKAGHRIELPSKFTFDITRYQPHAQRKATFKPAETTVAQKVKPEAAAEIEVTAAGVTQTLWLTRNHPSLGMGSMTTPDGELRLRLGYAEQLIGFGLKLVDFRREMNPGKSGNAAFSSVVRVVDETLGLDEQREVSMNEPLTHNHLTFYQSGFDDAGHGKEASTFSVAHDPGRTMKYAGSLMICAGIAIMFYMRAYLFKQVPRLRGVRSSTARQASAAVATHTAATGAVSPPKSTAFANTHTAASRDKRHLADATLSHRR
jgi:hypothetical protein